MNTGNYSSICIHCFYQDITGVMFAITFRMSTFNYWGPWAVHIRAKLKKKQQITRGQIGG